VKSASYRWNQGLGLSQVLGRKAGFEVDTHVDLDHLRPETRDDFRLRAEMSFIDLRSGCIYVNYACGTSPIPPDFGEVPCDE
jgi:hypothetical protein